MAINDQIFAPSRLWRATRGQDEGKAGNRERRRRVDPISLFPTTNGRHLSHILYGPTVFFLFSLSFLFFLYFQPLYISNVGAKKRSWSWWRWRLFPFRVINEKHSFMPELFVFGMTASLPSRWCVAATVTVQTDGRHSSWYSNTCLLVPITLSNSLFLLYIKSIERIQSHSSICADRRPSCLFHWKLSALKQETRVVYSFTNTCPYLYRSSAASTS